MSDHIDTIQQRLERVYRDRTPGSAAMHREAQRALPGGDTRESTFFQPHPLYVARGEGYRLWDVDGNEYLDVHGNHTSLIHGHAHPAVVEALRDQLTRGTVHGAPTRGITELAAILTERIPSIERIRFTTSGTEAVMHAIRAARAATGRPKILKMEGAYHGSYDFIEMSVHAGIDAPAYPAGLPETGGLPPSVASDVLVAPFNDAAITCSLIERHASELAAVIVEPMIGRGAIPATPEFLAALRQTTARHGIVLIFDEVQTFRLAWGGGQALYGIRPDLTTLGKVIGGGLPVGAFGGRAEIMDRYAPGHPDHLPHSGTFNGNAMTMAAGIATLRLLTEDEVDRLNVLGATLRDALQSALDRAGVHATVTGLGSYAWVHFTPPPVSDGRAVARAPAQLAPLLHLALLNQGIFSCAGPRFVLSTCMADAQVTQLVSAVVRGVEEVAGVLGEALAAVDM